MGKVFETSDTTLMIMVDVWQYYTSKKKMNVEFQGYGFLNLGSKTLERCSTPALQAFETSGCWKLSQRVYFLLKTVPLIFILIQKEEIEKDITNNY